MTWSPAICPVTTHHIILKLRCLNPWQWGQYYFMWFVKSEWLLKYSTERHQQWSPKFLASRQIKGASHSSKQKNILKIRSCRGWQSLSWLSVRLNAVDVRFSLVAELKEISHQTTPIIEESSLSSCFAYSLSHGRTPSLKFDIELPSKLVTK